MNVLFLDVDGVLNSEDYYNSLSSEKQRSMPIDCRCVARVKHIIDQTGAVIVLTSSWRGGWDHNPEKMSEEGRILERIFQKYGLTIYDKTPVSSQEKRPFEIRQWMKNCEHNIRRYVIIDDCDFRWKDYRMHRHWVATDFSHGGLSDAQAEEAILLFRKSSFYFFMERFAH